MRVLASMAILRNEQSSTELSAIELAILISRVESICAEMGAVLQHAAFSPNIKDRLDYSCALFDASGELFAQAAHIPVHLGSMAYAMADIVDGVDWQAGDMLVLNDPFLGGTHLPDVTMVAPLFVAGVLVSFVANRAHHANIGASTPGSMPISRTIEDEGLVIPPTLMIRNGERLPAAEQYFSQLQGSDTSGDFAAQVSANRVGLARLEQLIQRQPLAVFLTGIQAINDYGERLARASIEAIPAGQYCFEDVMDGDGFAAHDVLIKVRVDVADGQLAADFSGTSAQVQGNINCPLAVAAAAVYYVVRCLLPAHAPACAGTFRCVSLKAPLGSLVNAQRPAATAAGNVETSMRIVDVMLGALAQAIPERIPAASQGTMNNVAMGNHQVRPGWDYYETLGGGMGAARRTPGLSAVQCHMTNTLNTPIESLERHYPLRIREYAIRRGSGGGGGQRGGDGLVREFEFLAPAEVTLLTERRARGPWGLAGGGTGKPGHNRLDGVELPAKVHISVEAGQVLRIETPGGGGFGVEA
jgi:N-methylhydantoinase B